MPRLTVTMCVFFLASVIVFGQKAQKPELVDIELMTYPEIYSAIHDHGKTTVLVYNGGTEQRGPHAVLGGHTLMAHAVAPMIARKLGNALVAPILPFSVNPAGGVTSRMQGGIELTPDLFQKVNEAVVESMVKNGFKNIIVINGHGGGQTAILNDLTEKIGREHRVRTLVVNWWAYCSDVTLKIFGG